MSRKLTPEQINKQRRLNGKPLLNFQLFEKVIAKLEAAPEAYDQMTIVESSNLAPCGTAACIGGWADILSVKTKAEVKERINRPSLDRAADSLGLDGEAWFEEFHTERAVLFDGEPQSKWPEPYCSQWRGSRTPKQRAQIAVRYLKQIITTGKIT